MKTAQEIINKLASKTEVYLTDLNKIKNGYSK